MSWLFESRQSKERKSRFRQLVEMAMADGEVDPAEQALLENVAAGLDFTSQEVAKILSQPERIEFNPPTSLDDRLVQLMEIVDMMRADHLIKQEEETFALKMSGKLGIPPQKAPGLIRHIIEGIDGERSWIDVREELKTQLKEHP
jgi:uncharacterized tellurite resistance protein B-like protein